MPQTPWRSRTAARWRCRRGTSRPVDRSTARRGYSAQSSRAPMTSAGRRMSSPVRLSLASVCRSRAGRGWPACTCRRTGPMRTAQTKAPRNPRGDGAAGGDEEHDDAHAGSILLRRPAHAARADADDRSASSPASGWRRRAASARPASASVRPIDVVEHRHDEAERRRPASRAPRVSEEGRQVGAARSPRDHGVARRRRCTPCRRTPRCRRPPRRARRRRSARRRPSARGGRAPARS